jgi:hypothetical protein
VVIMLTTIGLLLFLSAWIFLAELRAHSPRQPNVSTGQVNYYPAQGGGVYVTTKQAWYPPVLLVSSIPFWGGAIFLQRRWGVLAEKKN